MLFSEGQMNDFERAALVIRATLWQKLLRDAPESRGQMVYTPLFGLFWGANVHWPRRRVRLACGKWLTVSVWVTSGIQDAPGGFALPRSARGAAKRHCRALLCGRTG